MTKYLLFVLFLCAAYYCGDRYLHTADLLDYARAHPQAQLSESIDYYAGLLSYMRGDYGPAQKAFVQLLQDYPKSGHEEKTLYYVSDCAHVNLDFDTERLALQQYEQDFPVGPNIDAVKKKLDLVNYEHPQSQ